MYFSCNVSYERYRAASRLPHVQHALIASSAHPCLSPCSALPRTMYKCPLQQAPPTTPRIPRVQLLLRLLRRQRVRPLVPPAQLQHRLLRRPQGAMQRQSTLRAPTYGSWAYPRRPAAPLLLLARRLLVVHLVTDRVDLLWDIVECPGGFMVSATTELDPMLGSEDLVLPQASKVFHSMTYGR
jgi:hypothetical protein